ncbi:hypothetical protein KCP74_14550 [Salmonella enterica subsp. enterica]|nr:hypothetical protein KCP74_14550 [Salmonella enterica subsp. enterica]
MAQSPAKRRFLPRTPFAAYALMPEGLRMDINNTLYYALWLCVALVIAQYGRR